MEYQLEYKRSVAKDLRKLPPVDRQAVVAKILLLKAQPKPKGSAKLKGSQNLFRIRHGDYRIIYRVQQAVLVVLIVRVGNRREIYNKL